MFGKDLAFECKLNDSVCSVYVNCTDLNALMVATPDAPVFYINGEGEQGQCQKKELTFIGIVELLTGD